MAAEGHERHRASTTDAAASAARRRLPRPRDGVTILSIAMLLLFAVPSNRTIGALGSAGSVALIWGLGAGLWWCWHMLQRGSAAHGRARGVNPVRLLAIALLVAAIVSYIAAMTRALPPEELNPADTGMIRLLGLLGILLVAADGPPGTDRLLLLIRRLVAFGGLYALLGLVQFIVGQPLVDHLWIPGLTGVEGYDSLETRGGLTRPLSTATHPLEYAFVLVAVLPLALALALDDRVRHPLRRWAPPALMMLALATSSSRSAWVGLIVGLVVLLPFIGNRGRVLIVGAGAAMFAAAYLAAPRAITNLLYIFTAVGDDTSAASRTDSSDIAAQVFSFSPIVGRGFGTFLPQYRILDNQILLSLIEIGLLGVIVLTALLIAAAVGALVMRRRQTDRLTRSIGAGLAAAVAAAASLLSLFDALSFPQAAGTLFLLIGLCGSYWRLGRTIPADTAENSTLNNAEDSAEFAPQSDNPL